jgi:hypothetical protein
MAGILAPPSSRAKRGVILSEAKDLLLPGDQVLRGDSLDGAPQDDEHAEGETKAISAKECRRSR